MSLLQPDPETFELFDDIILLSEGEIVYQGPRELVLEFFENCGFKCPDRKGTADFLQEVTSKKDQKQYWANESKPYRYVSVFEFARRFKASPVGIQLENELAVLFHKTASHKSALVSEKCTIPKLQLLKTSIDREWLLMKRTAPVWWSWAHWISPLSYGFNALTVNELLAPRWMNRLASDNVTKLGVAVLNNFDVDDNKDWYWIGAAALLGFTILFNVLFTFALMYLKPLGKPQAIISEDVANQQSYLFIQTTYYSLIVYSMVSFEWTAAKFFWFFFISFFSFLYFTYYGMMTVSITPNHQAASIFASAFFALFALFSGFFIPKPKWWIWYYYICPTAWTVYGLIVTQYGDIEDTIKVPGVEPDPTIKWYVENHFGYDLDFMWPTAAILVAFSAFFALLYAFCIQKLNFQNR